MLQKFRFTLMCKNYWCNENVLLSSIFVFDLAGLCGATSYKLFPSSRTRSHVRLSVQWDLFLLCVEGQIVPSIWRTEIKVPFLFSYFWVNGLILRHGWMRHILCFFFYYNMQQILSEFIKGKTHKCIMNTYQQIEKTIIPYEQWFNLEA